MGHLRLSLESGSGGDQVVPVETPSSDPGRDRWGDPLPPPLPTVPASVRPGPAVGGGGIGWKGWALTLASMAVSVAFYAMNWTWGFAFGFTVLILVHEIGHLVAARSLGLRVGPPVFIPFFGASIRLKERPRNAWDEAVVGIAGPIFGTFAAGVCVLFLGGSSDAFWRELAFYGFFLNLFNLTPAGFLDGGRIVGAVSPWLWVPGFALMAALCVYAGFVLKVFPLVSLYVLFTGLPRLFSLFRPRDPFEQRYHDLPAERRRTMGAAYFGLVGILAVGLYLVRPTP